MEHGNGEMEHGNESHFSGVPVTALTASSFLSIEDSSRVVSL